MSDVPPPASEAIPPVSDTETPAQSQLPSKKTRKGISAGKPWKSWGLSLYRVGVMLVLLVLIRQHFDRLRIQGDAPIEVTEIQTLLPEARLLRIDTGPRAGVFIDDGTGTEIGYAVRTSPQAEGIIGYAGPTDTLVVFGPPTTEPNPPSLALPPGETPESQPVTEPTRKILGIKIRHSWDTKRHIQWVTEDAYFMQFWQGRDWSNIVDVNFYDEYMEGVSGATLSSMGIARSIQHRFRWSEEHVETTPELRLSATDYGLWIAMAVGLFVTFKSGWKGQKSIWTGLKIAAFVYVGFWNGSLIALGVLSGYTAHGIAWQVAPGLVSLVLISFLTPLTTRRQVYCNHLCPHGAAQQLLSRYVPWKYTPPRSVAAGLRWLPWFLLVVAISFLVLRLPLDLAHLEPFDAYLFRQADWIPIGIAIGSLIVSAFVPMAYCKYGCPTGMLLEYVRSHGRADHWSRRDLAALCLLGLTYLLIQQYDTVQTWLAAQLWT